MPELVERPSATRFWLSLAGLLLAALGQLRLVVNETAATPLDGVGTLALGAGLFAFGAVYPGTARVLPPPARSAEPGGRPAGARRRPDSAMASVRPDLAARWWLAPIGVLVAALGELSLTLADASGPPLEGVAALAIGVGLFAFGVARPGDTRTFAAPLPWTDSPARAFGTRRARVAALTGGVLTLWLMVRLVGGSTSGRDLLPWIAGLAAFAIPFAASPGRPALFGAIRRVGPDLALGLLLTAGFVALSVWDGRHWYYSVIGDEYAHYWYARDFLASGITRPFSQAGVYERIPVLDSVYQALVMAIFGQDHLGWVLASTLSAAAAIPGMYLLGMALGGRAVGFLAAAMFAFSHYVLAFAHLGYNIVGGVAPAVWALALFVEGTRRRSALLLYGAGVAAGLGFYTYYYARVTLPIVALFVLTGPGWRTRARELWPLAFGFALAVWPIVAVSREEVLTRMVGQAALGYAGEVTGPVGARLLANVITNGLAFQYSRHLSHFVSGALLDPLSGLLAALGLGLALRYVRHEAFRLLLIWALLAFVATGLVSPYPHTAITRLHSMLPPLALLGGFAAWRLWRTLPTRTDESTRTRLGVVAVAALAIGILALNAYRFWVESPKQAHLSQEAVAIGAMRSETCGNAPETTIIVARTLTVALQPALISYDLDGRLPRLIEQDSLVSGQPLSVDGARCIIFTHPADPAATLALADLVRRYPAGRELPFTDFAGKGRVAIFVPGGSG